VESAELVAILREVRDRVRAANPETSAGGGEIPLPDLMELVRARDAALGKVAAIGTVNPRRGGLVNWVVQSWKRLVARMLDWYVREQVEFNRKLVGCVDTLIEALNDNNRALSTLAARLATERKLREELEALKDIRSHWAEWRFEWERKLAENEVQFLRSVADLQGGFQHRVTLMDANYRDALRAQHTDFHAALDRYGIEIQKRLWDDLERIRLEYEQIIHAELRTVRRRAEIRESLAAAAPGTAEGSGGSKAAVPVLFDYGKFAEKFRGPEEYVRRGQQIYVPHFAGRRNVLDIGCGRGEFLETMREAGVSARGIDLSEEAVATCRHKGLEAQTADLFEHLDGLPEGSLDGIFCSQVVEHLPPERLPAMIQLCASRLAREGAIAIETPNPECLAIFSTHFYLDPTHTRPIPPPLLAFYLEEFGIGRLEVKRLSPAVESMPPLGALPQDFREAFFGSLDYAVLGKKL
jgi:2-polyprenyl-3-methyl-5-hydroxy-6-metoxy-1,4-benzoquinol methylase